ncbi:LytR/AlgR family response regulator transcription factor [Rubrivivax albus]|uniref:Response regulator transcription factor n=1 Tax=Rubrivivax albus TaxID=2499835 RepID=A0A3S2U171_9BURK|nr:LytTR family DNA-binding domain-containing protein [Rubrivivax albus]RVT49685.1 response regulator transcription factor [Rubrivivax albus]
MTTRPTALIAEDEPLLAAALQAELTTHWPALQVAATVGDGASALAQALALQPTLCFLDIRMPGMSGLEAAQALAEDWPDGVPFPLIVFVTAYDQYALQAFEAQAVDYLLKPVDGDRLAACVARLQARLAERQAAAATVTPAAELARSVEQLRGLLAVAGSAPATAAPRLDVVTAQVGATVHLVPVDEVIYFEAADKYVRVVTAEREHLIRTPLKDLLPQLDPQRFWQVHRGTVVQARCVRSARREESGKVTLTLAGRPETLTASRLYAHLFKGM